MKGKCSSVTVAKLFFWIEFVWFGFCSLVISSELRYLLPGLPVNQMSFGLWGADALSAQIRNSNFFRFWLHFGEFFRVVLCTARSTVCSF